MALGVFAVAFHLAVGQLHLGGPSLRNFTSKGFYDAVMVAAAASCLLRAWLVRQERLAWALIGLGLAFNAAAEIYYSVTWGDSAVVPMPSIADALYLAYYPAAYAGIVLLARARTERFRLSSCLDGAIAGATSAAILAAVAFEPILHNSAGQDTAAVITTLAYPVGDLVLIAMVVGVFGFLGWRPGRAWLLLLVGMALWAIADTVYAAQSAEGTYVVGGWLDSMWLAAAVAMGASAWQPSLRRREARLTAGRLLAVPGAFALMSLGLLVYGGVFHVSAVALALAGISLLLVNARAAWTFAENVDLLEAFQKEAVTDALTGLGNRRQMVEELERALALGASSRPAVLLLFDLDGFKLYNDEFGHLAGDTMLAHLGRRLRVAVGHAGRAFRLGGDEFCVLLDGNLADADVHVAAAVTALTSEGEGFSVTASLGRVEIPREAANSTAALRLADTRMYAHKGNRRQSARQQTHDVLLGLLREREPDLHEQLCRVGRLAGVVARRLGIGDARADDIGRAAELHDIGKAAIPDAILNKKGPLTADELAFVRRHTAVGERILAAAPALAPMAALIRSSHERWDGTGYPDGLGGEQIPLGARVIAVCDAFTAMTANRAYAPARTAHEAIEELRRGAGSQFDPDVVEAFAACWAEDARNRKRGLDAAA